MRGAIYICSRVKMKKSHKTPFIQSVSCKYRSQNLWNWRSLHNLLTLDWHHQVIFSHGPCEGALMWGLINKLCINCTMQSTVLFLFMPRRDHEQRGIIRTVYLTYFTSTNRHCIVCATLEIFMTTKNSPSSGVVHWYLLILFPCGSHFLTSLTLYPQNRWQVSPLHWRTQALLLLS